MNYFLKLMLCIVALIAIDRGLSHWANQNILARNADFEANYDHDTLEWPGSLVQGCKKSQEFLIYTYKTCFYVIAITDSADTWAASYIYTRPRPKTSLTRLFMSSKYYFRELPYGKKLFIIKYDGTIVSRIK